MASVLVETNRLIIEKKSKKIVLSFREGDAIVFDKKSNCMQFIRAWHTEKEDILIMNDSEKYEYGPNLTSDQQFTIAFRAATIVASVTGLGIEKVVDTEDELVFKFIH